MLVVKIELWRNGSADDAQEIARGVIWNAGRNDIKQGGHGTVAYNYGAAFGVDDEQQFAGIVKRYPDHRAANDRTVWNLVRDALNASLAGTPKSIGVRMKNVSDAAKKVLKFAQNGGRDGALTMTDRR